jgi:Ser/Thr protein kinase RdoA (MazF antagonist)
MDGYREVAPLTAATIAELPVFIMLRRVLLLAWIASHSETPTAQELGTPYTEATLTMAEHFLARFS